MIKDKKQTRRKIIDIICYIAAGILLVLTVFGIIARVSSNNNLFIFGSRIDVVLTDSMSSKNEKYIDFLKGHDDQIQPFDVVLSKKIQSEQELNVYDIVLFKNPKIGTDMHRIVDKTLISSTKTIVIDGNYRTIDGIEGICLDKISSGIVTSSILPSEISVVTFSKGLTKNDVLNFSILNEHLEPQLEYLEKDGGIYTTYHAKRENQTPGKLLINHINKYDYTKEVVVSCKISMYGGLDAMDLDKDHVRIENDQIISEFNQRYEYEIRGDKASTSDGKFTIEQIISKVTNCIPKIGYVVRYLTSVWGIVMIGSIGVIIIVYDVLANHLRKKSANNAEVKEEGQEDNDEEKH